MKIVLIIPPTPDNKKVVRMIDCSHETKANYLWQPNDFMIITSHLKLEDEVVFIDGTADALSDKSFFEEISKINGADILFFALSSVCWNSDYDYFKKTKKKFTDIPVFVIGDIFVEDKYRRLILEECDGIVIQPYQLDIEKMLKIREEKPEELKGLCIKPVESIFNAKKKIQRCEVSNSPRHRLFLKPGYRFPFAKHFKFATVTTVWGCPFNCSYCTDSKVSPVVRQYTDIVKELEQIAELRIKELFFADKTFGFPYKNAFALLEEMANRFSFSWSCYFHPQLYDFKLLEAMKKAGCHTIIIGIDSANYDSLVNYNRKVKKEKVEALINHASKIGMSICADFILGLDHETEEDIIKTTEYSLNIPIDFASFNIATPLPGSSIREKAIREGKIKLGEEGFDTLGNKEILGSDKVSSKKLLELRKKAIKKFYLRPSYIFNRVRKTTSVEHFMIQFSEMISMFNKI